MYFQIENTPERVKRTRKKILQDDLIKEEIPRLTLAPFSKPPQVVFDNVLLGTTCKKNLEVLNPLKHSQQITLGKALPPGLNIQLPGDILDVEPETCYCLNMLWTPTQPTALRKTICFTNENRGRYDVIVVLKSAMNTKGKNNQPKFKISPGKMKNKVGKKSPVAIYKKKVESIKKVQKTVEVVKSTQYKMISQTNKENAPFYNNHLEDSNIYKCPFDSPTSIDLNFNTSEIFSNMLHNKEETFHQTYDKSYSTITNEKYDEQNNILKPSNRQTCDTSSSANIFDNLTFTPLKSVPSKNEKLNAGPKIILSINSESDFDDSLDINRNKENSIMYITSSKPKMCLTVNQQYQYESNAQATETPTLPNKKIPNTSSPKEFNSPNFSINTDFSRISDLSFLPQRFSTEHKILAKINNRTHEIIDDSYVKLSSDTYTKESPFTPFDNSVPKEVPPKLCRQALFKEYQEREVSERNYLRPDNFLWNNDLRLDVKSPPRSLTPPLQSIPEESGHFSETQVLDKTDNFQKMTTFTINRTFDNTCDKSTSVSRQSAWSKRAVRAEPELWKMPVTLPKKSKMNMKRKESLSGKVNQTFEKNKSLSRPSILNHIDNVYSQSFTVDPFLSSTYFYDEKAVDKFENEFKRWLNYILTPPADLDSNMEQKIDVGKAWIENRNKEVPMAPTKEQVCSAYHNSQRLQSLRRSAKALLLSPEICQVFTKLNAQIEKKLIAIRTDRNLHLNVGLQKVIMELLLSYNPLWLRIGLEAIYGLVLPLKSNSDIEGLTTFIIQRMFKNLHLKNKHSKASDPNWLSHSSMEAIKKFTLKKFFMLVFFLDQAKQKKLISHDPCLFCRNAVCKESREILIRFNRELITGIGDITKHLRPLGFVVSHKQSYLDEYKYAVHNIAVDMRDGVRLTKVMEIILMKNGLLHQLRTPAISRLQKIHNVSVALNALKEANFVIVGDISAVDIADGHREKTLSLLWQLIHVFRAPLFEKAANVIQMWWKKKYEVIVEKRKEEERILIERNTAASNIQYWWRRIKYNRMMEYRMHQITIATIVIQKYCRKWLCRSRLRKLKASTVKIAQWYKSMKLMQEAKDILLELRLKREELRNRSATSIQAYVKRWLCMKKYKEIRVKIILIQSVIRRYLVRKWYTNLTNAVLYTQKKYRSKLLMRWEMQNFKEKREKVILLQSYYKMFKQRKYYKELKRSVRNIEKRYKAILLMRRERNQYLQLRSTAIKVQSLYKGKLARTDYIRRRNLIITIQQKVRAYQIMKNERLNFVSLRNSAIIIQKHFKSYVAMKAARQNFVALKNSANIIQKHFKSYLAMKAARQNFVALKNSAIIIQKHFKSYVAMKAARQNFVALKNSAIIIQKHFKSYLAMKAARQNFVALKNSANIIQKHFKSYLAMKAARQNFVALKNSAIIIQKHFKSYLAMKAARQNFVALKNSAIIIQKHFKSYLAMKAARQNFVALKNSATVIQRHFRLYLKMKSDRSEFIAIKKSVIFIQKKYRSLLQMRRERSYYLNFKKSATIIQRRYRTLVLMRSCRNSYQELKRASIVLQRRYRTLMKMREVRSQYMKIKLSCIVIQNVFRAYTNGKRQRALYLQQKQSAIKIQNWYRALKKGKETKQQYEQTKVACIAIQKMYRAYIIGKTQRQEYLKIKSTTIYIQIKYRSILAMRRERSAYLSLKRATILIQTKYRALMEMKQQRQAYLHLKHVTITIQRRYRANKKMLLEKSTYNKILTSCITIQRYYRAFIEGRKQRQQYVKFKSVVTIIQKRYKEILKARQIRKDFIQLRNTTIYVQRYIRSRNKNRMESRRMSADKIQTWYISIKRRNECRSNFLKMKRGIVTIQSLVRMHILRKQYLTMHNAAISIQRYYRYYKLAKSDREKYIKFKNSIIKLQAQVRSFVERKRFVRLKSAVLVVQAIYKLKRHRIILNKQRGEAAMIIQKNVRRYLTKSWYTRYIRRVILIQTLWRGKQATRVIRNEFLQKKTIILKLQAIARGYLVRKELEHKKENLIMLREQQRRNRAASIIQALFRGHKVRLSSDKRIKELRRRWRDGALQSTQESLRERHEEAMYVLRNMSDMETVIRAFRSLELLTEVIPMMYDTKFKSVMRGLYRYMTGANRSRSSIEMLRSGASVLVNLTRYKVTGPKIYARDRILPVLKLMLRYSNSETQLFCILSTYLWLFAKYDEPRKDLKEFLHIPENHKILVTIKGNLMRMKRMASNAVRNKFNTPQPSKFLSHTMNQSLRASMNHSICNNGHLLPALETDYGITRINKPRYFEDPQQAIICLFDTYEL